MNSPGPREFAWGAHVSACKRCQGVTLTKPATMALACFEGGRLAKEALAEVYSPRRRERARGAS